MDFITSLPSSHGCSVIMVVADRLSKFAHFIPLLSDLTTKQAADLFIQHIVKIHGIPKSIILNRDKLFTGKF